MQYTRQRYKTKKNYNIVSIDEEDCEITTRFATHFFLLGRGETKMGGISVGRGGGCVFLCFFFVFFIMGGGCIVRVTVGARSSFFVFSPFGYSWNS